MSEIGLRIEQLDTPALWVDLDCLEHNIQQVARELASRNVAWRPHIKGIKVPAIAHMLIDAGAIGVTCAKLGEAEVMAEAGIKDMLVANQVVGEQKATRLAALQHHADVKVAVDSAENVAEIGRAAVAFGVEVGVLIEVDTGMHRAGVTPGAAVMALAGIIKATDGVNLRGLMTWEGHTVSIADKAEKEREILLAISQFLQCVEECKRAGFPIDIVSCGGGRTYQVTSKIQGVTEVQAGGVIFCDQTYQQAGAQLETALFLRTRVTSRPTPNRLISDSGFKTQTRGFSPPMPTGFGVDSVSLSAEHGIFTLSDEGMRSAAGLKVGDTFDLVPGYGDATLYLHDTLYGVRNGLVETAWDVAARGKLR